MLDYESLKIISWLIVSVFIITYAINEGSFSGISILFKGIGGTEEEKRLILAGLWLRWFESPLLLMTIMGLVYAIWPNVFEVIWQTFYGLLSIVFLTLFFRPLCILLRLHTKNQSVKRITDWLITVVGMLPAIVCGFMFGYLYTGFPFYMDSDLVLTIVESKRSLFSVFSLYCSLITLSLYVLQGASWLQMHTSHSIYNRARSVAIAMALLTLFLFVMGGFLINYGVDGYIVIAENNVAQNLTPLQKQVDVVRGGWLNNYLQFPFLMIVPVGAMVSALFTAFFSYKKINKICFFSSCLVMVSIIVTGSNSLFPFITPSSLLPDVSLTVWDAVVTVKDLKKILLLAICIATLMVIYTIWRHYKIYQAVRLYEVD